jgi:O-antigen ligase
MLISTAFYIISVVLSCILAKKNWWKLLIPNLSCIAVMTIFSLVNFDLFKSIFKVVIDKGFDDSGRFHLYELGLEAFKCNPSFGTGFFDYDHGRNMFFDETSFLSPRYHSTIIQIMASTGIVGCLAYSFHRIQTLKLVFKNFNIHKFFIGMSIAIILVNSLIDCMFFNFGPGLHYSCLLVMLEGMVIKDEDLKQEVIEA